MITAYDVFVKMAEEAGEMPTLQEWLQTGYKRTAYFDSKRKYKEGGARIIKEDKKVSYVYRITNPINGHYYIGRSSIPKYQRWEEHCYRNTVLEPEFEICPFTSMIHEVLLEGLTTEESVAAEHALIAASKSDENCLNLQA